MNTDLPDLFLTRMAEDRHIDNTNIEFETKNRMDDFTQFQLKEYENISQAHFKTNEVLATFYRYYLLITAIPITTIGLALINLSDDGISPDGRVLAHLIFGYSAMLLSFVGAAVISYIEKLRLNAILYARVVNSIRDYFHKKPEADLFGAPVLPRERNTPPYDDHGASFIIYFACAVLNSAYFSCGLLVLLLDRTTPVASLDVSNCQWLLLAATFLVCMISQAYLRHRLITKKKNAPDT